MKLTRSSNFILIFALFLVITALLLIRPDPTEENEETGFAENDAMVIPGSVIRFVEFIEDYIDSTHTVGAALTIVHNNRVILMNTYGLKKAGSTDSVNAHTAFRLASVSKGFAGVLACILEQDGVFSLDDRVISYLPGFRLKDSLNTNTLSIKHVLSHTSGLVPHAFDNLIEDGVELPLIIDQLFTVDISAPPGMLYGYQNVVFSLIDTIARSVTHTEYSKLLERRIFRPLRMRDASADEKIFLRKNGNFAYPHVRYRDGYYPLAVNLGYYNIPPAAGVNASISDLSKWLLALTGNNPEVLNDSLLSIIATPVIETPLQRRYTRNWGKLDSKFYSLGWRIYQFRGRRIVHHGGYVKGYRAEIGFCPEENIGIAFLQNSPNYLASMSLPTFFDLYFNELDSIETQMKVTISDDTEDMSDPSDTLLFNNFLIH